MKMQIAIIHFNTPVITKQLVDSIFICGNLEYEVTLFDNSDRLPYSDMCDERVTLIDNTKQQVISFEGHDTYNEASYRHAKTIQWLMDNTYKDTPFLLLDSDCICKRPLYDFFNKEFAVVGYVEKTPWFRQQERFAPYCIWFNMPMITKHNLRFLDEERIYGINGKTDSYDTGASFFEDLIIEKVPWKYVNIYDYVIHLGHKSCDTFIKKDKTPLSIASYQ